MVTERWHQVKALFHSALERAPEQRQAYLSEACAGDAELHAQITALLAAHEAPGDFLAQPAIAEAAEDFVARNELAAGQRVGPYEVTRKLGQGGMGVVFLARDARLGRSVALKLLHSSLTQDANRVRRFQQEARAASALNHPNIITIYEVGQLAGQDYIAAEFIEGPTLREMLGRGPLGLRDTLEVVTQVAHALEAAHQAGIVHRDIKPENLMLRSDGYAKVLDFGLAKLTEQEHALGETKASEEDIGQTNPGMVLGTVSYMSPEQALGRVVDRRSDLFSLGVVLYELLAGVPPFKGHRTAALLDAIIHHDPLPLTELRSGLPPELDRIVTRALEKDRELRYQTAGDLRADLKRLQREVETFPLRTSAATKRHSQAANLLHSDRWSNRRHAKMASAAGVVVLLVALSCWWLLTNQSAGKPSATLPWSRASATQLTDYPGEELFPHLSPDGKSYVYVRVNQGHWDIYQQRVSSSTALNLTANSPTDNYQPAFSPNGEQIAFRSERKGGGLFVMGALGESVRQLATFGYHPAWSPDGKEIVCSTDFALDPAARTREGRLVVLNVATGARRELATDHDAVQPQWSPHGWRIVYWSKDRNSQRDLWSVPAPGQGGAPKRLTNDAELDWNPVWSPDGKYIYFLSQRKGAPSLWRIPVEEVSGQVLGPPEAVFGPLAQIWQMSFSHDGRRLLYVERQAREHLYAAAFDPAKQTVSGPTVPLVAGSKPAFQPAVSPDGQWLAYILLNGGQDDIYLAKTDGTMSSRVTDDPHRERLPRWSPDGKRLIFYSNATGNYEIWTINPDGSDRTQLSFSAQKGVVYPSWSPDGKWISFCYFNEQTYLLDAAKPWSQQTPFALPPLNASGDWFIGLSWSPNGEKLAGWRSNVQGQQPGLYLYRIASQQYEQISSSGIWPSWCPDNRHLVYLHDSNIWLIDTQTRRAREILSLPGHVLNNPVVARDGRRLYYSVLWTESDIRLLSLE